MGLVPTREFKREDVHDAPKYLVLRTQHGSTTSANSSNSRRRLELRTSFRRSGMRISGSCIVSSPAGSLSGVINYQTMPLFAFNECSTWNIRGFGQTARGQRAPDNLARRHPVRVVAMVGVSATLQLVPRGTFSTVPTRAHLIASFILVFHENFCSLCNCLLQLENSSRNLTSTLDSPNN